MAKQQHIRELIAREAARLMYEEQIREYRDAKRKAAHRFKTGKGPLLGSCLPSNAEIHQQLQRLLQLYDEQQPERLLNLRRLALKYMRLLAPFAPYLIGSVVSGVVTARSDIDLHLFADSVEEVEDHLSRQGIAFETEVVTIHRGGEFVDYPHVYLEEDDVVIECSVYPPNQRRCVPKSSITGRAMVRVSCKQLQLMIQQMDA